MKTAARFGYGLVALVLLVCFIVQTFLAGLAVFDNASRWSDHVAFARWFEFLPLVLFLLSWVGAIKGWNRWLGLILFVLFSFQHITVQVFSGTPFVAALHPVNAVVLIWGSYRMMRASIGWLLLRKEA